MEKCNKRRACSQMCQCIVITHYGRVILSIIYEKQI